MKGFEDKPDIGWSLS